MNEFISETPVLDKEDDGTYTVKFRGRWITCLTADQATAAYEMGAVAHAAGREAFRAELQRLIGVRS